MKGRAASLFAVLAMLAASAGCTCVDLHDSAVTTSRVTSDAAPQWRSVDGEAGAISDLARIEQLAEDFPDSGSVRLRLLTAYLGANDKNAALREIDWLHETGRLYRFSQGGQRQLVEIFEGSQRAHLETAFSQYDINYEASAQIATIPPEAKLVESVLQHPDTGQILATSIISRQLFRQDADGGWTGIEIAGANSLSGMIYDPASGFIWVSSADLGMGAPEGSFHGLIAVDPQSGAVMHRIAAPEGVNPSDLTIASDGTLYVSDPTGGGIYRAVTDAEVLDPLVAAGTFRSPQGLAESADGSRLYVSDYRYGLAMIVLETGEVERLASESPMLLDGIDGLWRHGNTLIAVQNGTSPMQISAIKLSNDGRRARAKYSLETGHSEWTEPLGGSVADGRLLYVATGQWDRYGEGGVPEEGKPALPTHIRSLPLVEN